MTAMYVQLVLDLYDPQGNPLNRGQACITPSVALTDVPDMQVILPSPVIVPFSQGVLPPSAVLLASDNAGPQPSGWTWGITFTLPGLVPWSFYVPAGPVSFAATSAGPCVFTWTPGSEAWQLLSLPDGTGVQLSGGDLPGGFAEGATYYVTGSTGFTVQLAATQGGPALGSLSAGSGELTVVQWQLSALAPVLPVTKTAGYLPLPSGTPSPGDVITATGSSTWEWDTFEGAVASVNGQTGAVELTAADVGGPYAFPTAVTSGVVTLTFASTLNINAALGGHWRVTLTGNATVAAPTNPADGQKITFEPIQDSTGGRTLTWSSAFDFGSGSAPGLSGANKGDLLGFVYSANRGKWLFAGAGAGGF